MSESKVMGCVWAHEEEEVETEFVLRSQPGAWPLGMEGTSGLADELLVSSILNLPWPESG